MIYKFFVKNLLDRILAVSLITLLFPVFILSAILIFINDPGPIIFRQNRLGYKYKKFIVYKFRTMYVDNNRLPSKTLNYGPDVFFVGYLFRRLKIDELPQLFNVLMGSMSFVGPRPCLEHVVNDEFIDSYDRFEVKPGITGLSQVSGNVNIEWGERFKIDAYYTRNLSFYLDLKIMAATLLVVILGERRFLKIKI